MTEFVKLAVYVPLSHADAVRQAVGDAGAGCIGNYSHCSFSVRGQGRFKPNEQADPFIGEAGRLEAVEEERIEVLVLRAIVKDVIAAMRQVHPYEEVAFELYPVEISL